MTQTEAITYGIRQGKTLSTAESLTGGLVSAAVCGVSGASAVYQGGVAAYQDRIKHQVLHLPMETLDKYTAVSAACARAMARGVREMMDTDYALSTTGYAGPTGDEVGLVYIGIADRQKTVVRRLHFSGSRQGIRKMTVQLALWTWYQALKQENCGRNDQTS